MPEATPKPRKPDQTGDEALRKWLQTQGFKPQDFDIPIKDLDPDKGKLALQPLASILGAAQEILNTPMGQILSARTFGDDIQRLRNVYLQGGTALEIIPEDKLESVAVAEPPTDVLLRVAAKKASIRAVHLPRYNATMTQQLYEMVTDDRYITPRVTSAVKQLLGHGLISNPFDLGAIWYVRKNHDINRLPSTDDGCYLVFHLATEDGQVLKGVGPEERRGVKRLGIAVEFDKEGHLMSIKRYDDREGRKLHCPKNALIDLVPVSEPGNGEDYYTHMRFTPVSLGEGDLRKKILQVIDSGEVVGRVTTHVMTPEVAGRRYPEHHSIMVYELKNDRDIKAIGLGSNRIGLVTDDESNIYGIVAITEEPCPRTSIGGVHFGIHAESKDMGVRAMNTTESMMHELAIQERLWSFAEPKMTYSERMREIKQVLDELVNACEPELIADKDEQMRTKRRFLRELSPAVPYLIRLKSELPEALRQHTGGDEENVRGLAGASYAQLFQAAAMMVGKGRAVNVLWSLESAENFITGYKDYLHVSDREYAMTVGQVVETKLRPLQLESREGWREMVTVLQREGEMTRKHISFEARVIRDEIGATQGVMAKYLDRVDGRDQQVEKILEAFPEMAEVLESIGADTTAIRKALKSRNNTKLVLETGISSFLGAVKLKREISLGGVDDAVIRGAGRISEEVRKTGKLAHGMKDKLSGAVEKIGGALRELAQKMVKLEDMPTEDVGQLNTMLMYEAFGR